MRLRALIFSFLYIFIWQSNAQVWDFETVNFDKADRIAMQNKGADLDNLPLLVNKLTKDLDTDVERFRAIYLWVCTNVKNDYNLYAKNKRKRKRFIDDSLKLETWNTKFKKQIFKTLLKKKRTICTGYAYLVKTLSNLANIDCEIVDGFGKTATTTQSDFTSPNHSWTTVKLNDKWYLCDPTWASGTPDEDNGKFVFNYNDGFFLASPQVFASAHFPLVQQWFLLEETPTFLEFINAPVFYNQAYSLLASYKSPNGLYNEVIKNHTANFNYTLKPNAMAENIILIIDDGNNTKTLTPENIIRNGQTLSFDYNLNRTGWYDLHLMIDAETIASYTYRVKRIASQD